MSDAASTPTAPAVPSGERRQVTALFADMVGFSAISERLGEEGTFALIQPIYELMAGAVKEQGGSVKDFTGDGIMALFGVPEALEDAPLRACRAGLWIHERLAAAAPAIEAKHGVRPQMRIGVNSGLAVVTQIRGESAAMTALGDTVNLASRLQTMADPGTVYLSEATQRLVQGLVETTFAGAHAIKGKAEPQKVWRLDCIRRGATRFGAAVGRGLSAYVGPRARIGDAGAHLRRSARRASRGRCRGRTGHGQVAPAARIPPAPRHGASLHPDRKLFARRPSDPVPALHRGGARLVSSQIGRGRGRGRAQAGDRADLARAVFPGESRPAAESARPQTAGGCARRARRSVDRPAHARLVAASTASALPRIDGRAARRGPPLDRQRLAGDAGQDRRRRGKAEPADPSYAATRI